MPKANATLLDLRQAILDDLQRNDPGIDGLVDRYCREAVEYFQQKIFLPDEAFLQWASTTPNVATVPLPPNMESIDLIQVNDSNALLNMTQRPFEYMAENWYLQIPAITGTPIDWAFYENEIWLGPTPDQVYQLTATYEQIIPYPTFDNVSNFWTTDAEAMIRHYTEFLLRAGPFKEAQLGTVDKELADMEYAKLQGRVAQLASNRRRTPWPQWLLRTGRQL